jgi:hypothetical protein
MSPRLRRASGGISYETSNMRYLPGFAGYEKRNMKNEKRTENEHR